MCRTLSHFIKVDIVKSINPWFFDSNQIKNKLHSLFWVDFREKILRSQMVQNYRFGLSLVKDAGYSKLIVANSSLISCLVFAPMVFLSVLTGVV